MGLLGRREPYDRTRILEMADRARARGHRRRAIRLYRRVLAAEPGNSGLQARLAPLLARSGRTFDAWQAFRRSARGFVREGMPERALAIYREAAALLPPQVEAWTAIADLERRAGKEREALAALLEGRCHMRGRRRRPQAIHLLRCAREISPWHLEAVCDLARLLARSDQLDEAERLLDTLARRSDPVEVRRVRGVQWRLTPTLANSWRWLCAWRVARHPAPNRTLA